MRLPSVAILRRASAAAVMVVILGACSSSEHVRLTAGETLPPLPPTVASARRTTSTVVVPTYIVQRGDTFLAIADRLGVDPSVLAAVNDILDKDALFEGQVLQVPPTTAPTTTRG